VTFLRPSSDPSKCDAPSDTITITIAPLPRHHHLQVLHRLRLPALKEHCDATFGNNGKVCWAILRSILHHGQSTRDEVHTYAHMHTCIHAYMHIHTHTCTHTTHSTRSHTSTPPHISLTLTLTLTSLAAGGCTRAARERPREHGRARRGGGRLRRGHHGAGAAPAVHPLPPGTPAELLLLYHSCYISTGLKLIPHRQSSASPAIMPNTKHPSTLSHSLSYTTLTTQDLLVPWATLVQSRCLSAVPACALYAPGDVHSMGEAVRAKRVRGYTLLRDMTLT